MAEVGRPVCAMCVNMMILVASWIVVVVFFLLLCIDFSVYILCVKCSEGICSVCSAHNQCIHFICCPCAVCADTFRFYIIFYYYSFLHCLHSRERARANLSPKWNQPTLTILSKGERSEWRKCVRTNTCTSTYTRTTRFLHAPIKSSRWIAITADRLQVV